MPHAIAMTRFLTFIAALVLLQHFTNGVLMSEVRDEDPEKRSMKGLLGVQVHTGPPMKVEFRNIG